MSERYEMKSITVALPWPDKHLSPNNREHYQVKARYIADARRYAEMAAIALNPPRMKPPLFWHVEIYPPDFRRRDADNVLASLKSSFDGIMQAVGIDDNLRVVTSGGWHVAETRQGGQIVITIGEDH